MTWGCMLSQCGPESLKGSIMENQLVQCTLTYNSVQYMILEKHQMEESGSLHSRVEILKKSPYYFHIMCGVIIAPYYHCYNSLLLYFPIFQK